MYVTECNLITIAGPCGVSPCVPCTSMKHTTFDSASSSSNGNPRYEPPIASGLPIGAFRSSSENFPPNIPAISSLSFVDIYGTRTVLPIKCKLYSEPSSSYQQQYSQRPDQVAFAWKSSAKLCLHQHIKCKRVFIIEGLRK